MARLPPIVAFAAPSGTGKTTVIEQVVRAMVGRGLRVGVLKADAHRVVLDTPGKDSWRFAEAGAGPVAVLSAERLALFEHLDGEVTLVSVVDRLFPDVDIVLVEGFRRSGMPTVRVHRVDGPSTEGWEPPLNVVAWASDGDPGTTLPVFPLAAPERLAEWLIDFDRDEELQRLPATVLEMAVNPSRAQALVATARAAVRKHQARTLATLRSSLAL